MYVISYITKEVPLGKTDFVKLSPSLAEWPPPPSNLPEMLLVTQLVGSYLLARSQLVNSYLPAIKYLTPR